MTDSTNTTRFWLWLIRAIGEIVPQRLRADRRQEWEAELRHREMLVAVPLLVKRILHAAGDEFAARREQAHGFECLAPVQYGERQQRGLCCATA